MTNQPRCQCPEKGVLQPGFDSWYNPTTELPFVSHAPGACECTNELQTYIRDGKAIILCSCCRQFDEHSDIQF